MRFGGPAQAMNLIKLISSLSKHHSDPPLSHYSWQWDNYTEIHGARQIVLWRGPSDPGLWLHFYAACSF